MKIFKSENEDTILALNLEEKTVSTRSSYYESFFSSLVHDNYTFFDFDTVGVKSADKNKVVFYSSSGDDFTGAGASPEETFLFIGEASNYEELEKILPSENDSPSVGLSLTI